MKLFALTFGGLESASTHYRLFQYRDLMDKRGITFDWCETRRFSDYVSLADYDVVILQKSIASRGRLKKIRRYARRLVYDADDRIWMSPQKKHHWFTRMRINWRMRTIATIADLCVAANHVIAHDLRSFGAKVSVIPMSLDLDFWRDCPERHDHPVIGWSGAPKNTAFLKPIVPVLKTLLAEFDDLEICIHSGKDPELDGLRYTHIPYQAGEEADAICRFSIGLLPLPNDTFVAGKSPIKSLQYMATGAVVVGNGVGAVREIVVDGQTGLLVENNDQWLASLRELIQKREQQKVMAANAKRFVMEKHEIGVVFDRWIDVVGGPG